MIPLHYVRQCWSGAPGSAGDHLFFRANMVTKCISRESNPGLIDGNDEFYH